MLQADARQLPLPEDSVDLIVTSPPYYGLRSYEDGGEPYQGQIGNERSPVEYVDNLVEATIEWVRVLKPTGSLWVNLGDRYVGKRLLGLPWRYALRCVDGLGLLLRAELVWDKPNGLPESQQDRLRRTHEQWFHFVLQPNYFAQLDNVRVPRVDERPPRRIGQRGVPPGDHTQYRDRLPESRPEGRLPGSVWSVANEPLEVPEELGVEHYAAFPTEFPCRFVQGFCPSGGVVLDPFGGTGTTALVAKALGRIAITVDRSSDYCRLAQWRVNDHAELYRAQVRAVSGRSPAREVIAPVRRLRLRDTETPS